MGQAWGDWQQESGSHRLDPVPEWSLSVFLGRWGGLSLGETAFLWASACLFMPLSISPSLSVFLSPLPISLCVCFTASLSVYLSVSLYLCLC